MISDAFKTNKLELIGQYVTFKTVTESDMNIHAVKLVLILAIAYGKYHLG